MNATAANVVSLADFRARRSPPSRAPSTESLREHLRDRFTQAFINAHPNTPVPHIQSAIALGNKLLDAGRGFCETANAMAQKLDRLALGDSSLTASISLCVAQILARAPNHCTQHNIHHAVRAARLVLEGGGSIDCALYHAYDHLPPWPAA